MIYNGLEVQCEESLLLGIVYHFKKKDELIKAIKKLELMHILWIYNIKGKIKLKGGHFRLYTAVFNFIFISLNNVGVMPADQLCSRNEITIFRSLAIKDLLSKIFLVFIM